MQEIGIDALVLAQIRQGDVQILARLGKTPIVKLRPGDLLLVREDVWEDGRIVSSAANQMTIEVSQVLYFETLREMLESIDHQTVVPDAESIDDAIDAHREYFSAEDEEEYGVVALMFDES